MRALTAGTDSHYIIEEFWKLALKGVILSHFRVALSDLRVTELQVRD